MANCDLFFYKCELNDGDGCACADCKDRCTNGLAKRNISSEDIELLGSFAREWGFMVPGVESFLVSLDKCRDWNIALEGKQVIDLIKWCRTFKFVPYDGNTFDEREGLGAIDLKRLIHTEYPKRTHGFQTLGYGMSMAQMESKTPENYFSIILNRPFQQRTDYFRQMIPNIIRVPNNSPKIKELHRMLTDTFEYQTNILNDRRYFDDRVERMGHRKKGCRSCFDKDLCFMVQNEITEEQPLGWLLNDKLSLLPYPYRLRWSELNSTCPISRIYSKLDKKKIPEHWKLPENKYAREGIAMHMIFNGQDTNDLEHNKTLLLLGEKPRDRREYCEKELIYRMEEGFSVVGHADALIMARFR